MVNKAVLIDHHYSESFCTVTGTTLVSKASDINDHPNSELIFVTNITNYICGEKLSCGEILEKFGKF